jgi:hypothetical protein
MSGSRLHFRVHWAAILLVNSCLMTVHHIFTMTSRLLNDLRFLVDKDIHKGLLTKQYHIGYATCCNWSNRHSVIHINYYYFWSWKDSNICVTSSSHVRARVYDPINSMQVDGSFLSSSEVSPELLKSTAWICLHSIQLQLSGLCFQLLPPANNCFLQFLGENCNRYTKVKK